VHDAGAVAIEDQLAAADIAGDEVASACNLRAVPDIKPAMVEDAAPFVLQNVLVGEGATRDAEEVPLTVLDDQLRCAQDAIQGALPWAENSRFSPISAAATITNSC